MRFLASRRWRIFLIAWILYSIHFATNVVREHYPAFTIAEHGTFRVDEYQGFHADIFVHRDGHSVIGNQVLVSVLAAVPLFVFDPVLDALENYSKERIAREGVGHDEYRIDRPNRVTFFRLVKERGLDLRFGAATFITTAFFMAPLTAAFLVYFYTVLRARAVDAGSATSLTFVLGFGTPIFFRTTTLNHNLFVMYAMFIAFCLMWLGRDDRGMLSPARRFWSGFFAGMTLATDYVGVIILPLLWSYFVLARGRFAGVRRAVLESAPIVLGSLPPLGFLFFSQWAMYGDPFRPGQSWMPNQNAYVNVGLRGWTLPDPELFWMSLFDQSFGLYTWGPILLMALIPARRYTAGLLVLPRFERRWLVGALATFLVFASANQYSRLQYNSGFRYLIPLVPFLALAIADHWTRLSARTRLAIAVVAVVHSWVLTVFREPILRSWQMFFEEGVQLPWYRVLILTSPPAMARFGTWVVPAALLVVLSALAFGIWRHGARLELEDGVA